MPPCGGRRLWRYRRSCRVVYFNSCPPAGGAYCSVVGTSPGLSPFQFMPPCGGRHCSAPQCACFDTHFNSCPPAVGRKICLPCIPCSFDISIHAPLRGGVSYTDLMRGYSSIFQFMPPPAGGVSKYLQILNCKLNIFAEKHKQFYKSYL